MKIHRVLVAVIFVLFFASVVSADVKLPSIFGDGMVIQRETEAAVWGKADPGEKVTVKGSWLCQDGTEATADKDGKWMVRLATPTAGGPFSIEVKGKDTITLSNVMSGEVWVCGGQSNMEFRMRELENSEKHMAEANIPAIRLFNVAQYPADVPQDDCVGSWSECSPETVRDFSAVGYFFGRELNRELNVPIGLIGSNWGGSPAGPWMRKEYLQQGGEIISPILKRYEDFLANFDTHMAYYEKKLEEWNQKAEQAKAEGEEAPGKPGKPVRLNKDSPSSLYNGMIAPIIPYGIKGVIWYQGESNSGRAWQYRKLFPTLIKNWRDDWGQGDFPFYFVQIAPHERMIPDIRQAQLISYRNTVNTGIVVTTDIGNIHDIHPVNKLDVGKRLSLWAFTKDYGKKGIVYSGPLYKSYEIQGDKIRISFDFTGSGLMAKGGPLSDFTIAGADNKFVEVVAVIDGETVLVSSDKVASPKSVRFAWRNIAEPNFFNKEGLPASPFRTDEIPGPTFNNR